MVTHSSNLRCFAPPKLAAGVFLCAILGILSESPVAAQIKLETEQSAVVRNGAGVARLKLTNGGSASVPLKPSVGFFTDDTSHAQLEQPKVDFVPEAGGDLPATLGPGASLIVAAEIRGLGGSLSAEAPLFNQGQFLGTLQAVAVDTPLNVSLDGRGTPDKPLEFVYGRSAVIPLKNGSKDFLSLEWRFRMGGNDREDGSLTMAPGGQARVVVHPAKDVYSLVDYFRPTEGTGVLSLRPRTSSGVDHRLFDLQPLQVNLTMNRVSHEETQALFALYVMFFLLQGGVLSLLANSILPNILRRITFEKQVAGLADRTSSLSYRVDSYLRVLLRLERKKVQFALGDATWYSLSIAERIDAVAQDIVRLDRRLTVTERMDQLRRRFEDISASAPPSATDAIDQLLQNASHQLHSFSLPEEVVNAANDLLAKAAAQIDAVGDSGEQGKRVAANFKEIKTRLAAFPKDFYADLEIALPGVFRVFTFGFDDPANIVLPMLFAVDHAIAAGQLVLDYAMVRATIAQAPSPEHADPGKDARARLLSREPALLEHLGTLSWKALRDARILMQQMRENVYEEDVLHELSKRREDKKPVAKIVFDSQRARPYLPIYFSLAFDNPRFKNAAALSCLTFRWAFPGDMFEEGSKVCHYFVGNEPEIELALDGDDLEHAVTKKAGHRTDEARPTRSWLERKWRNWRDRRRRRRRGFTTVISVSVQKPNDLSTCARIHEKIKLEPRKRQGQTRTIVELVRFMLAFGVALAGVEAGALDQLRRLDFLAGTIAVVALGFGADSIKNLLAQGPKKAG